MCYFLKDETHRVVIVKVKDRLHGHAACLTQYTAGGNASLMHWCN